MQLSVDLNVTQSEQQSQHNGLRLLHSLLNTERLCLPGGSRAGSTTAVPAALGPTAAERAELRLSEITLKIGTQLFSPV